MNEKKGRLTVHKSAGNPLFALPFPFTLCGSACAPPPPPTAPPIGTLQFPSASSSPRDEAAATSAAASMYFLRSRSRYSKTSERDSSQWITSRSLLRVEMGGGGGSQ